MKTIEKLTDEERAWLHSHGPGTVAKTLRIIDQLTAALEAERAKREQSATDWKALVEAAESRADALQAEVARLTAALEAARNQRNDAQALLERNIVASRARAEALQARVAELEAENAEQDEDIKRHMRTIHSRDRTVAAAESELADLRGRAAAEKAVLDAVRTETDIWQSGHSFDWISVCAAELARREALRGR